MNKDYERYSIYKEALKHTLQRNDEEMDIQDEGIDNLARDLINQSALLSGEYYDLPKEFKFLLGTNYISDNKTFEREIKKLDKNDELYILIDSISDKLRIRPKTKSIIRFIYVRRKEKGQLVVHIDTRLNSMIKKSENEQLKSIGQIFVANLFDLVEIYNKTGDALFEKNVRFSLDTDKNGVEIAIHNTLRNEPENFWFYNNGITMLADEVDYSDNKSIMIGSKHDYSVINGAQTLTACADYFYNPDTKQEDIDNAKKAYVMLRIISVETPDNKAIEKKRSLQNKISISLNRQKPIDSEDLAFNSELVFAINDLEMDEAIGFSICRKGEQRANNSYLLTEVARLILAARLQRPGAAKNTYRGYILRMSGEAFDRDDIFHPINIKNANRDFVNYYGFVNIAKKLYDFFDKNKNVALDGMSDGDKARVRYLFENGQFYFVSIIIRALFFESDIIKEIDRLEGRIKDIYAKMDDIKMKECLTIYREFIVKTLDKKAIIDYQSLKKDEFYKNLCTSKYYIEFKEDINNCFSDEDPWGLFSFFNEPQAGQLDNDDI